MSRSGVSLLRAVATLALLALGAGSAQAQTIPETRVTIAPDPIWSPPKPEDKQDFSCGDGKVLIGRKRDTGDDDSSDENDNTQYLCGKPMQYGEPLTLEGGDHSPWYNEDGHTFIAPFGNFVTGRYHWGDEEEDSRYEFHRAVNTRGEKVWAQVEGKWYEHSEGSGPEFTCPANQVIIARYHLDDENGMTGYLCASLWAAPQKDYIGTIVFYDKGDVSCTLPVPNVPSGTTWTYHLRGVESACPPDIKSMQMFLVPSATRITLGEGDACEKELAWVQLRTIKQPTTMEGNDGGGVNLPELFKVANNKVLRPGVTKVDADSNGNHLENHLWCVRITTSPEPPAASAPAR